jgi:hypothetical protein
MLEVVLHGPNVATGELRVPTPAIAALNQNLPPSPDSAMTVLFWRSI